MYLNGSTHRRDPRMADSDGADYATRERRRAADLRFIAALRTASAEELREALEKAQVRWHRVALERALARVER